MRREQTGAPHEPRTSSTTFSSLAVRAYRQWFISQILSVSGTMAQIVALSWLVLQLTHSGVALGLLSTAAMAPLLLAGPWAGALVDRVDRRRLLIVTQSLYIALSVLLAVLSSFGAIRVWMIFAIAFASGVVGAPDTAARQVYVNDLVGAGRLSSAVSLNEVVINASRVIGPAAGGLLLATAGVGACIWANAASFVPSLVVLLVHRRVGVVHHGDEGAIHDRRFMVGWRYAWRHSTIRLALFLAAASGMLFNMNVSLPLVASRVFHLGGGGFGLMMSAFGVGGILGGLAAAGRGAPSRRSMVSLAVVSAGAVLATASARDVGQFYAGLVVTGATSIWFIARANTLVQHETESRLRGRVLAIWSMALPGMMPLTSPLVGWVGAAAGPREGFGLAGAALLVIAVSGSIRFGATRARPHAFDA
ncbi:MAG: MFS transporter [Acidobacteriota bacterium]|nr:MFS transporter [Acidobacteriota bacterium]MDE3092591.1 MFS transporter [Acidobacteriota bacterium]MDE3138467.1 MFS transporter [Acidobacteriota bacterium]